MSAFDPKADIRCCAGTASPGFDSFSSVRISGFRKKQPLAINLVVGDGLLALRRYQPVDEHLAQLFLHLRMFVWVHQNDGVLIEHASVAFHQDLKVALVFERNPSAAVGECIAAGGRVLYGAWAFIPRSIGLYPLAVEFLDVDPIVLVPEHEFTHGFPNYPHAI